MLQNGLVLTDDINGRSIPGIEKFKTIVDVDNVWPLTFVEQLGMAELTAELSTSCYAGALMLQAMGLGKPVCWRVFMRLKSKFTSWELVCA